MGEWAEKLDEAGDELKIRFRGGMGYAAKENFGNERTLEIYFIDVGQGDAILIQTPDDKRILVDGGKNDGAHSFLKWKYHLKKYEKIFDVVILTHGDEDHLKGLIGILNDEKILVKRIYHNGIALRSGGRLGDLSEDGKYLCELYDNVEDLRPKYDQLSPLYKAWVDAVKNARKRIEKYNKRPESERPEKIDFECCRADQNTERLIIGGTNGVQITFIGPINHGSKDSPRLKVFSKEAGRTINGNSVAIALEYKKARVLLCGDMNALSEEQALERYGPEVLHANVFKANHHGSQDFKPEFLRAVKPWVSVVSSGDYPDYGHPRAVLLGCLGRYAPSEVQQPLIFSTEIAATFKPLSASQISELDMPEKKLESTSKKDTRIHLYEKTIHGLITIRTDGKWLSAGRVYGKQKGSEGLPVWQWEAYAFDLDSGEMCGKIPH
jgi:ribonuclease BN (tRNA processing enzyme)